MPLGPLGPAPAREYPEPVVAWLSAGRLRAGLALVAVAVFYVVSRHPAKVNLTKLADGLPTWRVLTRRLGRADRQTALWCLDAVGLARIYVDWMIALCDGRVLEDAPPRNFDARALEQIYERSVAPAGGVARG